VVGKKTIIILGGGIGGLVTANKLNKKAGKNARIILIDKNPNHVYAPSFLWFMLGKRKAEKIQKPLSLLKQKGIEFINEEVIAIDSKNKLVKTKNQNLLYDYLIISLGAELAPEKISGLAESGYNMYALKDVKRLKTDLENFTGGKIAIIISSLPFKCPAAPYEVAFLLDEYFQKKGLRNISEIQIYTPEVLPLPATGSDIGKSVMKILMERKIGFNPEVKLVSVNTNKKELQFENDKTANFDLLIFIPPHQGPQVVKDSGLGNEAGWITVDKNTLKTKYDSIFAIGDAITTTVASGKPRPKAGVFAHYEAEVVVKNIVRELQGLPADEKYNGYAMCFLETGFGKAGFAHGNFYSVPAPTITMRRPRKIWYFGKILFEKYWLWKWF